MKTAFDLLIHLFPHKDDKTFGKLQKILPDFLAQTSHLSFQQCRLALQLGEAYLERHDYREAMDCFVQAIKIAEQVHSNDLSREGILKISELHRFFSVSAFKSQLEKARQFGKPNDFKMLLNRLKNWKKFCHTQEGLKTLKLFFDQAFEVLFEKNAPLEFMPLIDIITL